ncbi:MAG: pseudouridine synthase [Candidatus Ozemobacteraceae bacterium]
MPNILYQDDALIAVYKPAGLHVHPTSMSRGEFDTVIRRLEDRLGKRLFTVQRLDRPTAGVMLFALSSDVSRDLCLRFREGNVQKTYLAVVRGIVASSGIIEYRVRGPEHDSASAKPGLTEFQRVGTMEAAIPVGRYASARFSLVEVHPKTGRFHQIRQHFHHIAHPIIGDTSHGDGTNNRLFREHFGCRRLLLAASSITFLHPISGKALSISAPPDKELADIFARFIPDPVQISAENPDQSEKVRALGRIGNPSH